MCVGGRALLLFPPGLEFITAFLGCLYSGTVAVPAYPPRKKRGLNRLAAIARDAEPDLILTTSSLSLRGFKPGRHKHHITKIFAFCRPTLFPIAKRKVGVT